jgi:hypothetical protein
MWKPLRRGPKGAVSHRGPKLAPKSGEHGERGPTDASGAASRSAVVTRRGAGSGTSDPHFSGPETVALISYHGLESLAHQQYSVQERQAHSDVAHAQGGLQDVFSRGGKDTLQGERFFAGSSGWAGGVGVVASSWHFRHIHLHRHPQGENSPPAMDPVPCGGRAHTGVGRGAVRPRMSLASAATLHNH